MKDFFTQTLSVGEITEHSWEYCKKLCSGKKVLHIGCTDYPFDAKTTMHVYLSKVCGELHGVDVNGVEEIRKYYNGKYFESVQYADDEYDVILVPNVIEHLKNAGEMVDELFEIDFKEMFVLVPNYFISEQAVYKEGIFIEKVHPDHYAWYSPYTLWNLFSKHIERINVNYELNFFDNRNMISILIKNNE